MKCLDEFSTYLCRQNVIREDELVVVQYGLNMFIANLSAFAITMMIAIMFHAMKCGICVFVLAFPLRKYAGGYHAKKQDCMHISFQLYYIQYLFAILDAVLENEALWNTGHFSLGIYFSLFIYRNAKQDFKC